MAELSSAKRAARDAMYDMLREGCYSEMMETFLLCEGEISISSDIAWLKAEGFL